MIEFSLFILLLLGVAIFHHKAMQIAAMGLVTILLYKIIFVTNFHFAHHFVLEWKILVNLLGLLLGFSILAAFFEESSIPERLPSFLPSGYKGPFLLLFIVFVLSIFLDNIAAAIIGGTIAQTIYQKKVHLLFLAAIIAASNAGGAGSVIGDTTTTLMWIDGVHPFDVLHAFIGSLAAFFFFAIFASFKQEKFQQIVPSSNNLKKIHLKNLFAVVLILALTILANTFLDFPALGVWVAIIISRFFTRPKWSELKKSLSGTFFLLSLVAAASLMPVEKLPIASWQSTFLLGFVSSVFDNIPLTKLCLDQGGYDWGILAYAVGYGGSMIWFGSSAGVALSNSFPELRSSIKYIRYSWPIVLAYIFGFFVLLVVSGWNPQAPHKKTESNLKQLHQISSLIV